MLAPLDLGFDWPSEQGMAAIAHSSYSPLALRDIPQPKPNDAPSDLDTSIFTFEDAFEDLLAVSQGQPLPDIRSRYEQRKLLRSLFPTGEPAYFWLRRLRSQGLLEESTPTRLMKSITEKNWERFHQELDRSAQAVWRAALGEDEDEDSSNFHGHHDQSKRDVVMGSQHRNEKRFDSDQDDHMILSSFAMNFTEVEIADGRLNILRTYSPPSNPLLLTANPRGIPLSSLSTRIPPRR